MPVNCGTNSVHTDAGAELGGRSRGEGNDGAETELKDVKSVNVTNNVVGIMLMLGRRELLPGTGGGCRL